jgi:Zn ribbon nucleic-acid-binding protein
MTNCYLNSTCPKCGKKIKVKLWKFDTNSLTSNKSVNCGCIGSDIKSSINGALKQYSELFAQKYGGENNLSLSGEEK